MPQKLASQIHNAASFECIKVIKELITITSKKTTITSK